MPLPIQGDLSDEHLAGIGLVIAQWAHVESLLAQGIVEILRAPYGLEPKDDVYLMAVLGMTGRTLIDSLRSTFKMRFSESHDELDKILDRFKRILDTRNLLAHTMWKRIESTDQIESLNIKTIPKLKVIRRKFTAYTLHSEAYTMFLVSTEFIRFMNDRDLLLNYKREAEILDRA
jgi:hypothetical protein